MNAWHGAAPWWLVLAGASAVVALWHTSVAALLLGLWRTWRPAMPSRRLYAVAAATLGCVVVLTLATPLVLPLARSAARGEAAAIASAPAVPSAAATARDDSRTVAAVAAAASSGLSRALVAVLPWLGAIAIGGILVGLARVAGGWVLVRRIRGRARPVHAPWLVETMAAVQARWGLPDATLLASDRVDAPVVVGARAPAILLPPDLERQLDAGALASVLAHELAHVQRRDYAANLLQSVVDALLWFSPGERWISRCVREAREYACDDLVAARCGAASYAAALTTLAGLGAAARVRPALHAVGPRLIVRIRRLLKEEDMSALARFRVAGLIGSVTLALLAGAEILPLSAAMAQVGSGEPAEWPVPYAFVPVQKGAGVTLRAVTPTEAAMCGTATVENRANVPVVGLRFAAFAHPRRGSHEPTPDTVRTSEWLTVAVAPGTTTAVEVGLMSRQEVGQLAGPDPQVRCALAEIRYANGDAWRSSPLVAFAPRPAEIPRALLGTPAPSDAPICKDDEGLDYSHGAVVRIALEPGTFATCDNGRWIEGRRSVGPPAKAGQPFVRIELLMPSGHRPSIGVKPGELARVQQWGLRPLVDAGDDGRVQLEVTDLSTAPPTRIATVLLSAGDPLTPLPGTPMSARIRATRDR